jgi:carbon-monoxide dehydrogenase iron sulfur subunit
MQTVLGHLSSLLSTTHACGAAGTTIDGASGAQLSERNAQLDFGKAMTGRNREQGTAMSWGNKKVIVHPERCVGCMQCMAACAAAHSKSGSLTAAMRERPLPKPRIHIGSGSLEKGFPNRCRHCDPAPCMLACLPGAIYRDRNQKTVLIDPNWCINCASCAMACPFGVIRYHPDPWVSPDRAVAVKCDNCLHRQAKGLVPACVEVCKSGALTFESQGQAGKRRTDEMARRTAVSVDEQPGLEGAPGFLLLNQLKQKAARAVEGGT